MWNINQIIDENNKHFIEFKLYIMIKTKNKLYTIYSWTYLLKKIKKN